MSAGDVGHPDAARRRRVLLVSFFFPPDPAVGGQRIWNFARYLPEFGWDPVVLTSDRPQFGTTADTEVPVHRARFYSFFEAVHPPDRPGGGRDAASGGRSPASGGRSAASGAPTSSMRHRALTSRWKGALYRGVRHFLPMSVDRMPDATLGWVPDAVSTGARLLRDGSFDAIFSSHGPPSSHMVAAALARKSGLPWVADFRDLWSENHADPRVGPFRWVERRLERRVLRRAAALSVVSPPWARVLEGIHGKRVEVVYNGFAPGEFGSGGGGDRSEAGAAAEGGSLRGRLGILFVGTLHPRGHDLRPLMGALATLQGEMSQEMDRASLQVEFLGTDPSAVLPWAEKHEVTRWVSVLPAVPRTDAVTRQTRATALLHVAWSGRKGLVPAKLFEYMGAGRPILAIGPGGGPDEEILSECGAGALLPDSAAVASRLREWIGQFLKEGTLPSTTDPSAALAYTRKAQTGRLAALLNEVVESGT